MMHRSSGTGGITVACERLPGSKVGTAIADASADPGTGALAQTGRWRLVRLSRRARQQGGNKCLPVPSHGPMATSAQATQPEGCHDVGADGEAGRGLAPEAAHSPSLAEPALHRQAPKVGAECPDRVRSDLGGRRAVMRAPTVIDPKSDRQSQGIVCPCSRVPSLMATRQSVSSRLTDVLGRRRTTGISCRL